MVNNTILYIFFILFWIYVIYNICNSKLNKEEFLSFPISSFERIQDELSETTYGKKTNIKEEHNPDTFLLIIKKSLAKNTIIDNSSLKSNQGIVNYRSLLEKYKIKKKIIDKLSFNHNRAKETCTPTAKYDNPYVFTQVKYYNYLHCLPNDHLKNIEFIYEPTEHKLNLLIRDPKEAIKEIEKEQNQVVRLNKIRQKHFNRGMYFVPQISKKILDTINKKEVLEQTKPFSQAILEPYNIDDMKPLFIYREKDNIKDDIGILYEGIIHRYNKYFVYNFVLDVTILENNKTFIIHDIDIIGIKSSDEVNTSFGKYMTNLKSPKICLLSGNNPNCNPQDVISFDEMKKNQENDKQAYVDESSKKCIGKYTFNRDECISQDPHTKKVGIWTLV